MSEKPEDRMVYRAQIHNLDDDSLLQIFSCFRLEDEESWNLRFTWRKLAHICRRWRYLIFDLSSHLHMCLPLSALTNDSPSTNTLSYLPPLLLVIDYYGTRAMTQRDEDNVCLGLQEHGRVRGVVLRASSSSLRMCLGQMNQHFPRLRDLTLFSTTMEDMGLVLPETFQAPDLRRLSLHDIGLPIGLSFLSSTIGLSTLSLTHIRHSCYFPPGHLVTQLQGLPHLEELSIGFAISPSSEEEPIPVPIPSVTLPSLRRLTFHGEDVYLDNLVAQINTPLLERLSLTFFLDLAFGLVNLTEFIHRTKVFGCLVAQIVFNQDGVSIDAGYYGQRGIGKLSLHVDCKPPDWQINSATQVCNALGNILSTIEDLTLDLYVDAMRSDWMNTHYTLDSMLWHELLLPFVAVKKLHIGSSLTPELSKALQSIPEGLVFNLLPKLQELDIQLEMDDANMAFSGFLDTRRSLGRPIALSALPISYVEPKVPRATPKVPSTESMLFDGSAFVKHMRNNGRLYRTQAMNLVNICRTFLREQEQTISSYNDLRSALGIVDNALYSATWAQKKTSKEADEGFKKAIDALCVYETKYYPNRVVAKRMEKAEEEDKSSSKFLNRLKDSVNFRPLKEEPMRMVEFHIHKSLPDRRPTIVKQMLSKTSGLEEVLWNFSHLRDERRLTLEQNPHFYELLPTSPEEYGGEFRRDPIETFDHDKISVLTDRFGSGGRVFLEVDKERRAFGNVWVPKHAMVFKDVCGKLEGEKHVGKAFEGVLGQVLELSCYEDPSPSPTSRSPNWSNLSSTTTPTTSLTSLDGNWTEQIRRVLLSDDYYNCVNIRISNLPNLSRFGYSTIFDYLTQ